jgi:hypothetical protein
MDESCNDLKMLIEVSSAGIYVFDKLKLTTSVLLTL